VVGKPCFIAIVRKHANVDVLRFSRVLAVIEADVGAVTGLIRYDGCFSLRLFAAK